VSLDAQSCVIQEFYGSIAALFCGAPRYSYAIVDSHRRPRGRREKPGELIARSVQPFFRVRLVEMLHSF